MQLFGNLDILPFVRISRLNWIMLIEWIVKVKYLTIILREID
jgi:hypothetical protein